MERVGGRGEPQTPPTMSRQTTDHSVSWVLGGPQVGFSEAVFHARVRLVPV